MFKRGPGASEAQSQTRIERVLHNLLLDPLQSEHIVLGSALNYRLHSLSDQAFCIFEDKRVCFLSTAPLEPIVVLT